MKKKIIIGVILSVVIGVIVFLTIFKIETVCFGDVCPDNGGAFILYRNHYSAKECQKIGGGPIIGIGWGPVYAGCSPFKSQGWSSLDEINKWTDDGLLE